MSRTDLDAVTLANILRAMVGDGSMKWVYEPIQASVLLDIADMLDENAKLRDERDRMYKANVEKNGEILRLLEENAKLRKLVKEALMANKGGTFWEYFDPYSFWAGWCKDAHELGIEVGE